MEFRRIANYIRPYLGALMVLSSLNLAASIGMLAIPWFAGQVLGGVVTGFSRGSDAVVFLAACVVIVALLNFSIAWRSTATTASLLSDVRNDVFGHLQRLPLSFHDERRRGDLLALLTYEIPRLSQLAASTLVTIPSRLVVTIGAIAMMYSIDPTLALVVPFAVPIFYLLLKLSGRKLRSAACDRQRAEAEVVGIAEEALEILPATKAFLQERAQAGRFQSAVERAGSAFTREGTAIAALEPLVGAVAALLAIAILVMAGRNYDAGTMSPAQLFSFLFYATLLTRPVGALAHVYGQVQVARGTIFRLQEVLDEVGEGNVNSTASFARKRGDVRFEGVDFAYNGRAETLVGVDLQIRSGETVALVGRNGAGKTALTNLLLRFYRPQQGRILLDGRDISSMPIDELRAQIGIVPQMPLLFHGTVRENIAFGAGDPSPELVSAAARLAQASEFIAELPDGMETVIGDRGMRLSGGQRQRIALARALIKDPPILILDEATSMFDDQGEEEFIVACSGSLELRTVILIAHRPATLALADRVILVDQGRVCEAETASLSARESKA